MVLTIINMMEENIWAFQKNKVKYMAINLKKEKIETKKEKIQPISYDSLTDREKQIVEDVIKELNLDNNSLQVERVKEKFQITPYIEMPYDKSIFYNLCKQLNIFISYQGHVKEGNVKYPIFSICGDCRDLDKLVMNIVKKYEKSNK